MFTTKANKAYAAALIAGIGSAIVASPEGFTIVEWLTIAGVIVTAFQATYWTSNTKTPSVYDGSLLVDTANPLKDTYSLEVNTPLEDLKEKSSITLQIKGP